MSVQGSEGPPGSRQVPASSPRPAPAHRHPLPVRPSLLPHCRKHSVIMDVSHVRRRAPPLSAREADARVAIDVKALQAAGDLDEARERFAELVARHQRRAAAHCVSLRARRGRRRRGGAGRLRQGVHAPRHVPRGTAVRGLVHAHPDQRMPGSAEGAAAPRAVDGAAVGRSVGRRARSGRVPARRAGPSPEEQVLVGRAAPPVDGGARRSCRSGSGWCSC